MFTLAAAAEGGGRREHSPGEKCRQEGEKDSTKREKRNIFPLTPHLDLILWHFLY